MARPLVLGVLLAAACGTTTPPPAPQQSPPTAPVSTASAAPVASASAAPPAPLATPTARTSFECGQRTATGGWPPIVLRDDDDQPLPAAAIPVGTGQQPPALTAVCTKLTALQQPPAEEVLCYARPGKDARYVVAVLTEHPNPAKPEMYWRLAVAAPGGNVMQGPKTLFSSVDVPAMDGGELPSRGNPVAITDFDRDGLPEIITRTSSPLDSSATPEDTYRVWTVKHGKVAAYAPTDKLRIVQLKDADADGVPDLVTDPHDIRTGSPMGWSGAKWDWTLLAHIDAKGTPSLSDPVAQQYARSVCATKPDPAKALEPGGDGCYGWFAHCARLWGIDGKTIRASLDAACAGAPAEGRCGYSMPGWKKITEWDPPFTLK